MFYVYYHTENYAYVGTRDYTAYCCVGAALEFRATLGDRDIMRYNHNLAMFAQRHLAEAWGTEALAPDAFVAAMCNVRLPVDSFEQAWALAGVLLNKHDTMVVVFKYHGAAWLRLSAQIFLEQQDVVELGQLVLAILPTLPTNQ